MLKAVPSRLRRRRSAPVAAAETAATAAVADPVEGSAPSAPSGDPQSPDAGAAEPKPVHQPRGQRLRAALRRSPAALARRVRAAPRQLVIYVARQVPAVAAGAAASIPVIVSTVHAVRAGWEPDGDDGIILTRALDVFTAHSPLIGQYSEAGDVTGQIVHSPGPLLYWLLAIPVRLGGPASAAIAMGVVNCLCIVICVVLARRRGGIVLMIATAIGIALMCQSLHEEIFHDVWNPSAAMFPFLALIFLSWSLASGDYRLLPAVVLFASFVTQTHLTYLAPTLVLAAVGVTGLTASRLLSARAARRAGDPRGRRVVWRWVALAAIVLGLCWSAPLIDELEHSPGNLSLIMTTVNDRGATLGPSVGWSAVAHAIGFKPWWLHVPASEWGRKIAVRHAPSHSQADSAIALLGVLALIAIVAALRRRVDLAAAALIALGMCLGLGANAASTPVAPLLAGTLGYTLWWGSQLGFWVYLVIAWSLCVGLAWLVRFAGPRLVAALRRTPPHLPRPAMLASAAVFVLAGIAGTADIGRAVATLEKHDSHIREYAPTTTIGRALDAAIPRRKSIQYVLGPLDIATQPIEPPIRFWLVKHGDRPLANGSLQRLGTYYVLDNRPVSYVLYISGGKHVHLPPRSLGRLRLVVRVHFRDAWGSEVMSAWAGRWHPPARRHHRTARAGRHRPVR